MRRWGQQDKAQARLGVAYSGWNAALGEACLRSNPAWKEGGPELRGVEGGGREQSGEVALVEGGPLSLLLSSSSTRCTSVGRLVFFFFTNFFFPVLDWSPDYTGPDQRHAPIPFILRHLLHHELYIRTSSGARPLAWKTTLRSMLIRQSG